MVVTILLYGSEIWGYENKDSIILVTRINVVRLNYKKDYRINGQEALKIYLIISSCQIFCFSRHFP